MKDFIGLIKCAKDNDENAMIELIDAFAPLIGKYTRIMNYDEDFRNDMILKLITITKIELDLGKFKELNNYIVLKYIETALYHHYIMLSKQHNSRTSLEMNYEYDVIVDLSDANESMSDSLHDGLFLDTVQSVLTEREYICVDLMALRGYTTEQVARQLGITKQAVNQCKNRALGKVKRLIL